MLVMFDYMINSTKLKNYINVLWDHLFLAKIYIELAVLHCAPKVWSY